MTLLRILYPFDIGAHALLLYRILLILIFYRLVEVYARLLSIMIALWQRLLVMSEIHTLIWYWLSVLVALESLFIAISAFGVDIVLKGTVSWFPFVAEVVCIGWLRFVATQHLWPVSFLAYVAAFLVEF